MDPKKSFDWGNLVFLELTNGKIRCGVCQQECVRLISHMNGSIECSRGINMNEFKTEYTKFKHRQSGKGTAIEKEHARQRLQA